MDEDIDGSSSPRESPDDWPLGDDAAELDALNRGNVLAASGDFDGAAASYRQAMNSGDPDRGSLAAIYLADLLEGPLHDDYAAVAAYDEAADASHPDWTPTARLLQGSLLESIGDVDGARTAYESVISSGHPELAPAAGLYLGNLLSGRQDFAARQRAFQVAIDSGHHDLAPAGAVMLGDLLRTRRDFAGARASYEIAVAANHYAWSDLARRRLSRLHRWW